MTGIHRGALTLDSDGAFDGMVSGTLTVAPGAHATIAGMVDGGLVVGEGAEVVVTGMVNGGIDNRGGSVTVKGMVTG